MELWVFPLFSPPPQHIALTHFLAHFPFSSPHRDQREEELGEYYMKKYAKSSVGET